MITNEEAAIAVQDRADWMLKGLDRTQSLLEIGPSHRPLAPRYAGWNTTIVDHACRTDLAEKYGYDPDTLAQVEEVDHVLAAPNPLDEQLPANLLGRFDAVLASHVLEHMPDPIAFFGSCERLLKPGGAIRLALPDKRRCFDFFRPFSSTGEWLEAHARRDVVHSPRTTFDAVAYAVTVRDALAWDAPLYDAPAFIHPLTLAKACFDRSFVSLEYFDFHAWRFSPASFRLLMLELRHLGLIGFAIAQISDTRGGEILVDLRRGGEPLSDTDLTEQRIGLLETMMTDHLEQIVAIRAGLQREEARIAP